MFPRHAAVSRKVIAVTTILLAGCASMSKKEEQQHHHHGNAQGHQHGHFDRHGNPEDLKDYLGRLESAERAEWQQPNRVVEALGLRAGDVACDIGAGPGYFALRMAQTVGPSGRVFAVDVEAQILEVLRDRIGASGARNVTPLLALPDDPLLPDGACNLVLLVNTYHHFAEGPAYLRRLARALAPGGRIVNIDFHDRELPVGPPADHRISREAFLGEVDSAGLALVEEHDFLPHQYFLVLQPR